MAGTITTPNLQLIYPDPTDLTVPFDWEVFLNDNFDLIDKMKVVGGMAVFNASQYLDPATGRFLFDTIVSEATTAGWLVNGLTIYFPAGTYSLADATHLTSGMVIGSDVTASMQLIGTKGSKITTGVLGVGITDILDIQGINNVLISGLTFVGCADTVPSCATTGIRVTDGDNIRITNCKFQYLKNGIMLKDATSARIASNVSIDNNEILDYLGQAINAYKSQNVTIRDNFISIATSLNFPTSSTGANAIEIMPGVGADEQQCRIEGNHIVRPRRNGISLVHNADGTLAPTHILIRGNTIDSPGLFPDSTVETTKATRGSGIYSTVAGAGSLMATLRIEDNFIRDALCDGIYVQDNLNCRICNNSIRMMDIKNTTGNGSLHGIDCVDTDYVIIRGNRIYSGYTATVLSPNIGGATQRNGINVSSADNIICKDNYVTNWFTVFATCLDMTVSGNRIVSYAAAIAGSIPQISSTGCTNLTSLISEVFVPVSQMFTTAPSGYTQTGSVVVDASNGAGYFLMLPYSTTSTANHSRMSMVIEAPKKRGNAPLIIKVPVRSSAAAFNANFDLVIGSYSLNATATQAFVTAAITASVAVPSSTCGPSIGQISIPSSVLPTDNSLIMVTMLRKDTQTTNAAVYGAKFAMRDLLGGVNGG